jgi:hypothetical protein
VFSAAVAFGSVLIYRRFRDVPTLLLLIGSLANFIIFAGSAWSSHAVTNDWTPIDSFAFRSWLFLHAVAAVAALCFPVGFVWHALRTTRNI